MATHNWYDGLENYDSLHHVGWIRDPRKYVAPKTSHFQVHIFMRIPQHNRFSTIYEHRVYCKAFPASDWTQSDFEKRYMRISTPCVPSSHPHHKNCQLWTEVSIETLHHFHFEHGKRDPIPVDPLAAEPVPAAPV